MKYSIHLRLLVLGAVVFCAVPGVAQRKPALTHDDYDRWPSISSTAYSQDGEWIAYAINPAWGDGKLFVQQVDGDKKFTIARGGSPQFTGNNRYVLYSQRKSVVKEREDQLKKLWGAGNTKELEAAAKKAEAEAQAEASARRAEMMARIMSQRGVRGPGRRRGGSRGGSRGGRSDGKLHILDLQTGKTETIERVQGHRLVKDGAFLVYQLRKPEAPKPEAKKPTAKKPTAKKSTAKKPTAKKPTAKKPTAKKPTAKKPEANKAAGAKAEAKTPAGGEGRRGTGERGAGRQGRRGRGQRGQMTPEQRRARMERMRGAGAGAARPARSTPRSSGSSSRSTRSGTRLVVRDLATGKETHYAGVLSYRTLDEDKWLMLTCVTAPDKPAAKKPAAKKPAAKMPAAKKPAAKQPATAKAGAKPAKKPAKQLPPARKFADGLHVLPLTGGEVWTVMKGKGPFNGITTDRHNRILAFTSNMVEQKAADARKKKAAAAKAAKKKAAAAKAAAAKKAGKAGEGAAKASPIKLATAVSNKPASKPDDEPKPRSDIYLWDFSPRPARRVVTHDTDGMPKDWTMSGGVSFSDDGSVLTFSVRGKPEPKLPKILPTEKVVVDIWHWNEGNIQPMQAKGRGRTSNSRTCAWHIDDERLVVLGDEKLPSMSLVTRDGSRAMASDSEPYAKEVTWDGRYSDYYLVNTLTGKRTKLLEKSATRPSPSPTGRYMMYFGPDYHWYCIDVATLKKRNLTEGLGVQFESETEDRPQPARAYGVVGWTKGEKSVLVNDRYDIWSFDVETGDATCITDGFGRANKIVLRYSRFDFEGDDDKLDVDDRGYLPAKILLSAKDDVTKARGYYTDSTVAIGKPRKVVMFDDSIGGLTRAKKADRIFFTLSDFDRFPDIWVADFAFGGMKQLTDGCPEMREVRWGSSELVNWTNADGLDLQGYLVKPEGFDPTKKYPMMVYFYERNADNVHRYTRPAPGTSPNAAYYVSNGYVWFVPDIVYTVGYPGESAEKCIISGVQHLIAKGFVDKQRIGMAGHSWGGYQTAHLVTRTNLFAAAESGAPVTNMFSAYGGIRYQSGMSRQFQYERTQSRIGGTPWQYPQRYWQNSPVFYADRVQTPMLILHNDNDGAVPWTNGIEFFMALRRLGKEAYLFNYNGEPHGLRKKANQKDWARRMQQFFDHHLKGKPAPEWMQKGVPYAERDREKIQHAWSIQERDRRKKAKAAVEATSSSSSGAQTQGSGSGNDRR